MKVNALLPWICTSLKRLGTICWCALNTLQAGFVQAPVMMQ